jgi:hypothetical protein
MSSAEELMAELQRLQDARDANAELHAEVETSRNKLLGEAITLENALEASEALLRAAEHALREIVGWSYNLLTQGESPTQRRQPAAQAIYDSARAALAAAAASSGEEDDHAEV